MPSHLRDGIAFLTLLRNRKAFDLEQDIGVSAKQNGAASVWLCLQKGFILSVFR